MIDREQMPGILDRLAKSKFRARFKLDDKDRGYINRIGILKMESHTRDFVTSRLAPQAPENDGKQTPFAGHPVFKAQHATATCCRKCLRKWYQIPEGRRLNMGEIEFVVDIIMGWISLNSYEKVNDARNRRIF